ncbi:MAG: MBOAT family protein [Lachnospiraceae bacterium]|nr:MBOAT family protein [Lachnospiraceae bacterium]
MSFNSGKFLIFFPCAVIIYYLLPKKVRKIWLLMCSYYFYMAWNPKYIVLLLSTTLVTYASGIGLSYLDNNKEKTTQIKRKAVVALSVVINLSMLIYFKYMGFFMTSVNRVITSVFNGSPMNIDWALNIVLPVGISFFIFQALSYTIDVYRGNVKAEKNIINYALFVSFFPQLVAGPIERSGNLLSQIRDISIKKLGNYEGIIRGLILMLWGFFMKVVIADRISMITDPVFDEYEKYGSSMLILAAVGFTIQIYCDFAGYSMIAIGAAKVMGIKLMENFDTPYFSGNIREFWTKWHISLSSWLRDYLYFPLGGSRCSKGRTYFNLMVTFLISGLWHGAAAKYVVWGGIHGVLQIISRAFMHVREQFIKKFNVKQGFIFTAIEIIVNFIVVTFAWIFFRAGSFKQAIDIIINIFMKPDIRQFINEKGFTAVASQRDIMIIVAAGTVLFVVDLLKKIKGKTIDMLLMETVYPIRAAVIIFLFFFIIIFGQYGEDVYTQPFVYFQF